MSVPASFGADGVSPEEVRLRYCVELGVQNACDVVKVEGLRHEREATSASVAEANVFQFYKVSSRTILGVQVAAALLPSVVVASKYQRIRAKSSPEDSRELQQLAMVSCKSKIWRSL